MTTSKGTIQSYNGVAAVDKKHQIIIDTQAFGEGQEHHTLEPVFGNIGTNEGPSRFSLGGKNKGQWQLYCLVHNVEK